MRTSNLPVGHEIKEWTGHGVEDPEGGELHLQPAWILALEGYGPEDYMTMRFDTSLQVLRSIAQDPRNDPEENYRRVSMGVGPFLGLRQRILGAMTPEFFFV